jgi:hypothetical protein
MSQLPALSGPAGAAFLLSEPAPLSTNFDHPEGRAIVREGAAYVTVNLLKSHDMGDVKAVAWRVIQESFDFLAARRETALSTAMGASQYLLWSRNGIQYDVTCVDTAVSAWSFQAQGTVGGAKPVPSRQTFEHHDALRFYRMSQCAKGLFDAYRNAYLALECLVSDVATKGDGESELNWLNRVIGGPLAQAVPSGLDANTALEAIYKFGRNPLFHAKITETFYPPHGPQTEEVQELFERLTLLLASLLQYRLGKEVVRTWATMSQPVEDKQTLLTLNFDEVCFENGADEIYATPRIEVIKSPRRFGQLWAKVFVDRPEELLSIRRVRFLRQRQRRIEFELDEALETSSVAGITFEINSVNRNLRAPKVFHPE